MQTHENRKEIAPKGPACQSTMPLRKITGGGNICKKQIVVNRRSPIRDRTRTDHAQQSTHNTDPTTMHSHLHRGIRIPAKRIIISLSARLAPRQCRTVSSNPIAAKLTVLVVKTGKYCCNTPLRKNQSKHRLPTWCCRSARCLRSKLELNKLLKAVKMTLSRYSRPLRQALYMPWHSSGVGGAVEKNYGIHGTFDRA
jgi:hypothetical protein